MKTCHTFNMKEYGIKKNVKFFMWQKFLRTSENRRLKYVFLN